MNQIRECFPDYDLQVILYEAFRGGDTHANRYFSDEIISDVYSYDRISSYPDVMLNKLYPESLEKDVPSLYRLKLLDKRHRAYVMRICLSGIKLKNKFWGNPYIPIHKCRNLKNALNDNGRVLEADYLEISLTDIDWKIILETYEIKEALVLDLYSGHYRKLPKPIRDTIIKYYKDKSILKNSGNDYEYDRAKGRLNACYGMMVENPIREEVVYTEAFGFIDVETDEREILKKHNKKAYLNYIHGVYVSAWARFELFQMMKIVQEQGGEFVYCDTDSVKFFGDVDFSKYNEEHKKQSLKNGAYAEDLKGNTYYLGMLELDGKYKKFKTMGAKKYAYVKENGELGITIAGVNKKLGAEELKEAGGLEAMKEGFTFVKGGGTESKYNDEHLGKVEIKEGVVDITSNLYIKDSTYTLGMTSDYVQLLLNVQRLKYADRYMPKIFEKKLFIKN